MSVVAKPKLMHEFGKGGGGLITIFINEQLGER